MLPFGLKNVGATFQREMNYAFHDIKKIVQPYLHDFPARSRKRTDHPIRRNLHKCVFCVGSIRLLRFVVSKGGI